MFYTKDQTCTEPVPNLLLQAYFPRTSRKFSEFEEIGLANSQTDREMAKHDRCRESPTLNSPRRRLACRRILQVPAAWRTRRIQLTRSLLVQLLGLKKFRGRVQTRFTDPMCRSSLIIVLSRLNLAAFRAETELRSKLVSARTSRREQSRRNAVPLFAA